MSFSLLKRFRSITYAPVCNPFGGLGLTGGIVDIGGLYDCLVGIHEGVADDAILDKYSEIRRQKYNEIVNPISSDNLLRMFDQDPDKALENDEFLKICKRTETDLEFAKEFQYGANMLKHDFTQYYHHALDPGHNKPPGDCVSTRDLPIQAAAVGVAD